MGRASTVFDVYLSKGDFAAGTYSVEKDFGAAGQVDYTVVIDVDELASTSYQCDVHTRETEADGWQLMGGMGAEAADSNGMLSFVRSRYVKVIVTVTGGEFPSGVFGY